MVGMTVRVPANERCGPAFGVEREERAQHFPMGRIDPFRPKGPK